MPEFGARVNDLRHGSGQWHAARLLIRAANQFTEQRPVPALPYASPVREQSHVLFNILLIYS
jgi:hypothetical protein